MADNTEAALARLREPRDRELAEAFRRQPVDRLWQQSTYPQQDDEVWLFKHAGSRSVNKKPPALAQDGFHTSWKLPGHPANEDATRASIAVRLLLGYEKIRGSTIVSTI